MASGDDEAKHAGLLGPQRVLEVMEAEVALEALSRAARSASGIVPRVDPIIDTQTGTVLRDIAQARDRGLAVVFITHNPLHTYPVGDRFVLLNRRPSAG